MGSSEPEVVVPIPANYEEYMGDLEYDDVGMDVAVEVVAVGDESEQEVGDVLRPPIVDQSKFAFSLLSNLKF